MRITISAKEASILQAILSNAINADTSEKEQTVAYRVLEQIINQKYKYASDKQKDAAKKATKTRTNNILRLLDIKITTYKEYKKMLRLSPWHYSNSLYSSSLLSVLVSSLIQASYLPTASAPSY